MRYASVCAIAKDEDPFLVEWAGYHLRLGFEHIYLFDNNSAVPARQTLAEFVANGLVTVIDWPLERRQQLSCYASALREFGPHWVWMAFIDLDEFLVPKLHDDIRDLLLDYQEFGGLCANWVTFGSGGRERRPDGEVLRAYTGVVARDTLVKTITRPAAVARVVSPHHFAYIPGQYCVNEDKVPVLYHRSYHVSRCLQLNHYFYKSRQDFRHKLERGMATQAAAGDTGRGADALAEFERQHVLPGVIDHSVFRLLDKQAADGPDYPAAIPNVPARSDTPARTLAVGLAGEPSQKTSPFAPPPGTPLCWGATAWEHLAAEDPASAFPYIAALIASPEPMNQERGYRCLHRYYLQIGNTEAAASLASASASA